MIFGMIKSKWQNKSDPTYFAGDIDRIRAHYEFRRDSALDEFFIDDITWHDLSMDEVFKKINPQRTTSGEQYLYYLLRSLTLKEDEYEKRRKLIEFIEKNPGLRAKLEKAFMRLGRFRDAKLHETFVASGRGKWRLILYIFLVLSLLVAIILAPLLNSFILVLTATSLLILNPIIHYFALKAVKPKLDTVNYLALIVSTAKKMKKVATPEFDIHFPNFSKSMHRLQAVHHIGGVPRSGNAKNEEEFIFTIVMSNLLLIDLILYEWIESKLEKHYQDIFNLHEIIGALDASMAIVSYRESLTYFSLPNINFDKNAAPSLQIADVAHPLVKNPVVNSIDTNIPTLLTGSNASGKSTFLKSITLNIIMAQSICTVLATDYTAPAFYTYSSMAIADNLLAGDSYFVAEIKSAKRIIDNLSTHHPVFCVIDEVLRGTNTIERVSASSELLKLIAQKGALCFAATHDIELCELLKKDYQMLHFTETITEAGEVIFDYKVRTGPATTRNAIKLLDALGFDKGLVKSANTRASLYSESGKWR